MPKFFVNPYTAQVMDLEAVPSGPGGAKVCPVTGKPLNEAAVKLASYPGPAEERAKWEADAMQLVKRIEAAADEPNAVTLGVPARTAPAE